MEPRKVLEFELITKYGDKAKAGNIYHKGKLWATINAIYDGVATVAFVYNNITDLDDLREYIKSVLIDWGYFAEDKE